MEYPAVIIKLQDRCYIQYGKMSKTVKFEVEYKLICLIILSVHTYIGTPLEVLWLRLCNPNAGDMGSISGWGSKGPHAVCCGQKMNKIKVHILRIFLVLGLQQQTSQKSPLGAHTSVAMVGGKMERRAGWATWGHGFHSDGGREGLSPSIYLLCKVL